MLGSWISDSVPSEALKGSSHLRIGQGCGDPRIEDVGKYMNNTVGKDTIEWWNETRFLAFWQENLATSRRPQCPQPVKPGFDLESLNLGP